MAGLIYYEDIELYRQRESEARALSAEEIIEFARQWDPQPFHLEPQVGPQWPLGFCASGLHSFALAMRLGHDQMAAERRQSALVAGLGWDKVEMLVPVRPGDAMRLCAQALSKRRSKTKPDRGIVTYQMELRNQRGEVALRFQTKSMIRCRPQAGGA